MDNTKRYERLLERYGNGDLDRRTFLGLVGCAGLAAGVVGGNLTGWVRAAHAEVTQIRFDGWGGSVSDALRKFAFEPYTAKTGIKVVDATFGDEQEVFVKAKTAQPGEYNLVHSSGITFYKKWVDSGMSATVNEANIPNLALVMPALMAPYRKLTPDSLGAAPYDYGTTGIAYRTDHISKEDAEAQGANVLLNAEYKGKIGAWNNWLTRAWYGALQTGQDPNNIQDIDAVWEKARENRELLLKYWESGAELMDLLAKDEIWVTEAWSGRVAALQEQGAPVGFFDPKDGMAWMEHMQVLKGSPIAECEELINFMLEPATAIAVAEGQSYPPSLDPSKVEMTDAVKALPAFDPTGQLTNLVFEDPAYWAEKEAEWSKAWNRIAKGA
jgi:spermidine/putrescine transport system substrate-binding protein